VDLRRDKVDPQGQGDLMEEDPQGSTQATPASLDTKEDQATEARAPQDPRMAGATPATPAIQDSNGTQGTRATTPATLQDILDTPRNREVQGQGLAFHLRQQEAPSRHRAPRKRRAATTVGLSLARKGRGLPRRGRVQAHVQGPHLHPQDLPHRDPCPQPSPSPGREEQSQCLHDRQAVQAKATVQA